MKKKEAHCKMKERKGKEKENSLSRELAVHLLLLWKSVFTIKIAKKNLFSSCCYYCCCLVLLGFRWFSLKACDLFCDCFHLLFICIFSQAWAKAELRLWLFVRVSLAAAAGKLASSRRFSIRRRWRRRPLVVSGAWKSREPASQPEMLGGDGGGWTGDQCFGQRSVGN